MSQKNQGFTPSLEDTFLEKIQVGGGRGGEGSNSNSSPIPNLKVRGLSLGKSCLNTDSTVRL